MKENRRNRAQCKTDIENITKTDLVSLPSFNFIPKKIKKSVKLISFRTVTSSV